MQSFSVADMTGALSWVVFTFLFPRIGAASKYGNPDTKGRSFTLAFFPEYVNPPVKDLRNHLYLSSSSDGTCTVSYHDDARRTSQIALVAHQVVEKAFNDTTQMTNIGTGVQPKAIYVDCTVVTALYGFNEYRDKGYSSDSFTVFPNSILSTEYLVASVNDTAFIGVVAVESDTTQLTINIKSNSKCQNNHKYYRSGDIINVTLAYGDVLRIGNSAVDDGCDFGGTEIQSSQPVAVFSGGLYLYQYRTHIVHQVPPVSAFSKTLIIPGFNELSADPPTVRMLASQDNTVLNITSEPNKGGLLTQSHHLNNREILDLEFSRDTPVVIQSNFPVMAVQKILFAFHGGSLLFLPGISQYEKSFLIRAIDLDKPGRGPRLTIVSESSSIRDVRVNGVYPQGVTWSNLTTLPYSIGSLRIQRNVSYTITSSSPILVRFHEVGNFDSYVSIAGYQLPESATGKHNIYADLRCLPGRWVLSLDLRTLNPQPSDPVSNIYLNKDNCTGTVQGDYLVFNKTYDECDTKLRVSGGELQYTNTVLYTRQSGKDFVTNIISILDITCTMPGNGTDSVHIYPDFNTTEHTQISGVLVGSNVDVSLYKDAAYQHELTDSMIKAKIGQPVYVQVTSAEGPNVVMVVRSCTANVGDDRHTSIPLIKDGCSTDARSEILVTRNQVTRFKFVMFDISNEHDGFYVTCQVSFCDPMDFSARCQQRCHTDAHVGIVG